MKLPWRIAALVAGVSALLVVTCLYRGGVTEPVAPDSVALVVGPIPVPAQPVRLTESLSPGAKELAFAISVGVWSTMRGDGGLFGGDRSRLRRRGPRIEVDRYIRPGLQQSAYTAFLRSEDLASHR